MERKESPYMVDCTLMLKTKVQAKFCTLLLQVEAYLLLPMPPTQEIHTKIF